MNQQIIKSTRFHSCILLLGVLVFGLILVVPPGTAQADESFQQTVTLSVENMTCSLCPYTVRKSLEQVSGVKEAKVDFDSKTATVTFDSSQVDVSKLTQATTNAGYPSTELKQ